jgi:hypothetical protein
LEQLGWRPTPAKFRAIARSLALLAVAALGAVALSLLLGQRVAETPSAAPVHRTFSTSKYRRVDHAIRVPVAIRAGNRTLRHLTVSVRRPAIRTSIVHAGRCYSHRIRPYSYDGQDDNPFCRVTVAGAVERALSASVSHGRGARDLTEPLRPGRHPIVDSFGHPFGFFKQIGLKRFRIYDESGRLYGTSSGASVAQVQGRGCMVTDSMSDRYMILALRAPDSNTGIGPRGDERDVGARGFVPRSVLPPGVFHRANPSDSANNDTVIDSFNSGCGAARPQPAGWPRAAPFAKPVYSDTARYQGAQRRCTSTLARSCGGHYGDYSRPRFAADVVPLTSASTGVRNGGVVRAYARTSQPWRLVDAIGYADPNVPCGHRPMAQWLRVDANPHAGTGQRHIFGWFPQPVRGLPRRRCTPLAPAPTGAPAP